MIHSITPGFKVQRPLLEGDQALLDAIEQIQPGERGDDGAYLIKRAPARRARAAGTFSGEVIVARALNESGRQEVAFIDVESWGILAGIDTREPGSRNSGEKQFALLHNTATDASTPEAQAIKIEAARRIRIAHLATA